MIESTKYLFEIAYDGTEFFGWQRQPDKISVQQCLEDTFSSAYKSQISFYSASRTDANVHACRLPVVANLPIHPFFHSDKIIPYLQRRLPPSITLLSATKMEPNFSLDKAVIAKCYSYVFCRQQNPFNSRYTQKIHNLDLSAMQVASSYLIGTHNFSAFTVSDGLANNPNKQIYKINWYADGNHVVISFIGNGFLYKMVRLMVGTLYAVGTHKISIDQVKKMLSDGVRPTVIQTASPQALYYVHSFLQKNWENFNTNLIPYQRIF
ncbi:MAG: tRNA pseudouridine(38-40) synthase TruA [Lentisphaeria bacterium]